MKRVLLILLAWFCVIQVFSQDLKSKKVKVSKQPQPVKIERIEKKDITTVKKTSKENVPSNKRITKLDALKSRKRSEGEKSESLKKKRNN